MGSSKYHPALAALSKKNYFKAPEAHALGIPARMLAYFCEQGVLERIGRGIYKSVSPDTGLDLEVEGLALTVMNSSWGDLFNFSALLLLLL